MAAERIDVLAVKFGEMPEPRGYAWSLNNGDTEYSHDPYCPVEPEEWSVASALYDADQCREFAHTDVVELIDALRGCRDALRETAKMHRLSGNVGHAGMCEMHADKADAALARAQGDQP